MAVSAADLLKQAVGWVMLWFCDAADRVMDPDGLTERVRRVAAVHGRPFVRRPSD